MNNKEWNRQINWYKNSDTFRVLYFLAYLTYMSKYYETKKV